MTSPVKKRKVNGIADTPHLSAFAARRTRKVERTTGKVSATHESSQETPAEIVSTSITTLPRVLDDRLGHELHSISKAPQPGGSTSTKDPAQTEISTDSEEEEIAFKSRAESPERQLDRLSIAFSTFKPSKSNTRELRDGTLSLKLAPGERLILLGQCEITVQKGQITVMGAILQRFKTVRYKFYAPLSHSLPVIRCLGSEANDAEIHLHQYESGLEHLDSLSPLFGRLWNDSTASLGIEYDSLIQKTKQSSFQILLSPEDVSKKAFLQPIISAPEWNQVLSIFSNQSVQKTPAIMICGPKSSGKSTFAKILTNRMLSEAGNKTLGLTGVAFLDIDPGQQEYCIPGQLSLVHIQEPNLGPPFAHPWPKSSNRLIRAHTIAAITPAQDPDLYLKCTLDLFAHYRIILTQNPNCPLVINTAGWVLGTGLEILVDLITKIKPTDVIYMSQEGPWDVVNALRDASKTTPVHTLPSQTSEYTTRTAAHLRTMQAMSYFHLNPSTDDGLSWNSSPLTSTRPWEIKYTGEGAGIFGILSYGEPTPQDYLIDAINGSILAVVIIDDDDAIPGLRAEIAASEISSQEQYPSRDKTEHFSLVDALESEGKRIVNRTAHPLPYFNPSNSLTLDPQFSHCIGLVLVRGIDVKRGRLQVLTPIEKGTIEKMNDQGKKVILVSGKFDTPGWAYTEDMVRKSAMEKKARKKAAAREDSDEEMEMEEQEVGGGEGEFANVPWVERLEGSQGRGVGAKVWRVRRDLGRSEGGD